MIKWYIFFNISLEIENENCIFVKTINWVAVFEYTYVYNTDVGPLWWLSCLLCSCFASSCSFCFCRAFEADTGLRQQHGHPHTFSLHLSAVPYWVPRCYCNSQKTHRVKVRCRHHCYSPSWPLPRPISYFNYCYCECNSKYMR